MLGCSRRPRRPRRPALVAALAALGAVGAGSACAGGAASHPPGPVDQGWIDTPVPTATAAPRPNERWNLQEQLATLRPASGRARSEHLGGDLEGEVLASPTSGYPLRGPTGTAPAGALLVERLFEAGRKDPSTYFVMIKHPPGYDPPGADWEYLVVAPDQHVEERGKLALCGRCHAEAPHDHLFGNGH
jgi:hypothetical protein